MAKRAWQGLLTLGEMHNDIVISISDTRSGWRRHTCKSLISKPCRKKRVVHKEKGSATHSLVPVGLLTSEIKRWFLFTREQSAYRRHKCLYAQFQTNSWHSVTLTDEGPQMFSTENVLNMEGMILWSCQLTSRAWWLCPTQVWWGALTDITPSFLPMVQCLSLIGS